MPHECRKWKVDPTGFMERLRNSDLCNQNDWEDIEELKQVYNTTLQETANELAPLKKRAMCKRKLQLWFTPRLAEVKGIRKRVESKWLKTKLAVYQFKYHHWLFQQLNRKEKIKHYSSVVKE